MFELRLVPILVIASLFSLTIACGGDFPEECTPDGETCVCVTTDAGAAAPDCKEGETGDGEECYCDRVAANNETNNGANNGANNVERRYRFVLLEDQTSPVTGEFPGADVDAVELIKAGGSHFASAVEDANVPADGNAAPDVDQLLGATDAGCDTDPVAFTALGGADAGGFVIVSFGTAGEDVAIENGDSIKVYELGNTLCGQFDDDPYRVSIGIGNTLGSFTETGVILGGGGDGVNEIPVFGLE
jgi:hypothetical protein